MPARPLSPPPMEVQFLDDTGRPNKRWLDWLLDLFNSDQIGDGDSFQRLKLSNLLAPTAPYNGDNEQWSDTDLVPEGWTKQYVTGGSAAGVTDIRLLRKYYQRSTDSFRGNYAQSLITPGDLTTGIARASRPEECKEFLSYEVTNRAKIDHRPAGNHGYIIEVDWFSDDSSLVRGASGFLSTSSVQLGAAAPFAADNTYQPFTGTVSAPSGAKFARIVESNWGPNKGSAAATTITSDTFVWRLKTISNLQSVGGGTLGGGNATALFVIIDDMVKTITTRGGPVALLFSGNMSSNLVGSDQGIFQFFRDGVALATQINYTFKTAGKPELITMLHIDNPSAAAHTFDIRYKTDGFGQALSTYGTQREFQVCELV